MRTEEDFCRSLVKAQNVMDGLEAQLRRRKAEIAKLQRDNKALNDRVTELEGELHEVVPTDESIKAMGWMKLPVGGDGKPIRPGDKVFGPLGEEVTVAGVSEGPWVVTSYYTQLAHEKAVNLTHEEPKRYPLDADGVECKPWDTVWLKSAGRKCMVVVASYPYGVLLADPSTGIEDSGYRLSSGLTHTEPDSWEKLESDAEDLRQIIGFHLGDYEFEEGSGREGKSVQTELLDMIRRAKALAGVQNAHTCGEGDAE